MKLFSTVAVAILMLVACLHLLRILRGWKVLIGGVVIPMWASYVGFVFTSGLAVMLGQESCQVKL